jgi:hypothetical protein
LLATSVPARPIENEGAQAGDRKILGITAESLQNINNRPPISIERPTASDAQPAESVSTKATNNGALWCAA